MTFDDYRRYQKKFNVKIGDIVTVYGKPEHLYNWPCDWVPEMDQAVGKSGIVLKIIPDGILVKIPGIDGSKWQLDAWYYPYTALNIVR